MKYQCYGIYEPKYNIYLSMYIEIHPSLKYKFLVKAKNSYHFFGTSKNLLEKIVWRQQSKDSTVIPWCFKIYISFLFFLLCHVQHITTQSLCMSPHAYMWYNYCCSRHCIFIPGRGREEIGRDIVRGKVYIRRTSLACKPLACICG